MQEDLCSCPKNSTCTSTHTVIYALHLSKYYQLRLRVGLQYAGARATSDCSLSLNHPVVNKLLFVKHIHTFRWVKIVNRGLDKSPVYLKLFADMCESVAQHQCTYLESRRPAITTLNRITGVILPETGLATSELTQLYSKVSFDFFSSCYMLL